MAAKGWKVTAVFLMTAAIQIVCSGLPLRAETQPPVLPAIDIDDPLSFRSFDGSGNNLADPALGIAGSPLIRLFDPDYPDGSSLAGADRPNPRTISNAIGPQMIDLPSDKGLSAMFWSFGQLLAHDLTLVLQQSPPELAGIPVMPDDFDGLVDEIPFNRSVFDPATGTDILNPRQQINAITPFIDASFVYGSDLMTADLLRTNDGTGKLVTGPDNMLPTNGQLGLDANPGNDFLLVAGDIRVNEQLALAAMHTIFLREHNRLAEQIAAEHPELSGEEVYQTARALVGAQMQAITYNEFLPVLLGEQAGLPSYGGYDPTVDPGISNSFATAAFRLGHTLLQNQFLIIPTDGPAETLPLAACFFNPACLQESGVEATLLGLLQQDSQILDTLFVDAVRNQLITDFGVTIGVDLVSLNIQRGRDHGLPSFQDIQAALVERGVIDGTGTLPVEVLELYGDSGVDLFIGGLAEPPVGDALVGEVFHAILSDQFLRLRAGDRFWYEREGLFDTGLVNWLDDQRLTDIILRNTDLTFLQELAFFTVDFGLPRARTVNQFNTALYLNGVKDAGIDLFDLYVAALSIVNVADAGAALDQLSPEWFDIFNEAGLAAARSGLQDIDKRFIRVLGRPSVENAPQTAISVWASPRFGWRKIKGGMNHLDAEADGWALSGGVDVRIKGRFLVGLMAATGDEAIDSTDRPATGDTGHWSIAGYAGMRWRNWRAQGAGGFADLSHESRRGLIFDMVDRTAVSAFDGDAVFLDAKLAYDARFGDGWYLSPEAGVQYISVEHDELSEINGGALNLDVFGQEIDSLRGKAVLHLSKRFAAGRNAQWLLDPYVKGGITHEFEDSLRPIEANVSGDDDSFTVFARPGARTTALVSAGLSAHHGDMLGLFLDYSGEVGSGYRQHTASAGISLSF